MAENEREKEEDGTSPKKKRGAWIFWAVFLALLTAIFAFRVYWTKNYGVLTVDGNSMYTTLQSGDQMYMQYNRKAKRGDVIVIDVREYAKNYDANDDYYIYSFDRGGSKTEFLVKRLIALEGDKIYCENGVVYLLKNGDDDFKVLKEDYIRSDLKYSFGSKDTPYEVGEGEIFFLGDNRTNSLDDRYFECDGKNSHINGLYKEKDILAVVPKWSVEKKDRLQRWIAFSEKWNKWNPLKIKGCNG